MNLLKSKLTHNEILQRTGIQMTRRQLSQARMGREPALSKVKELLSGVDPNQLQKIEEEAFNIGLAQTIIELAKDLLTTWPFNTDGMNKDYLRKYKIYIDLKVEYNKLGITPRNHGELIALHQKVRAQHEETKKLFEMPIAV